MYLFSLKLLRPAFGLALLISSTTALRPANAATDETWSQSPISEQIFDPTDDTSSVDPRYPFGYPIGQALKSRKTGDKIQFFCLEQGVEICNKFQFVLIPNGGSVRDWSRLGPVLKIGQYFESVSGKKQIKLIKSRLRELIQKHDRSGDHAIGLLISAGVLGSWLTIILKRQDLVESQTTDRQFGIWMATLGSWVAWNLFKGGSGAFDLTYWTARGFAKFKAKHIQDTTRENYPIRSHSISQKRFDMIIDRLKQDRPYWSLDRIDGIGNLKPVLEADVGQ